MKNTTPKPPKYNPHFKLSDNGTKLLHEHYEPEPGLITAFEQWFTGSDIELTNDPYAETVLYKNSTT